MPPPEIRALRDLTRARLQLVRDRTWEWQRLEKLLEGALVKLSSVVSSLARTKTARVILEALAGGERDPRALAALAALAAQVKGGRAAIERSLDGMMTGGHHPMLIRPTSITSRSWSGRPPRSRTRSRPPSAPSRPPGNHRRRRPVRRLSTARTRRPCPRRSGSRRSPASASCSPGRSSPKPGST